MKQVLDAMQALLMEVPIASLAVRVGDDVDVSLVPFVYLRAPARFVLCVSELAAHTAALRVEGRAALMVHRGPSEDDPRDHHATERAVLHVLAETLSRDEATARRHDDHWRARFPHVGPMVLGLKDFHFVELTPEDGRVTFVQGFGRAYRVRGAAFDEAELITGR